MPLDEKRLSKLKELIKITNEGLTREEFLKSFQSVVKQILEMEKRLIEKIDFKAGEESAKLEQIRQEFKKVINNAKKETDTTFKGFRRRSAEAINNLFAKNEVNRKLRDVIKEVNVKMASIRNGINGVDGIDADEDKIIKEVLKQIEVPDQKKELKQLEERVMEEIRRHKFIRGGGTSAMGVAQAFKWILKTEAPVGAINGSNTTYTVNHVIFAVLAFSLNGEVISQLPNYTISNKTITFSTALPVAYSGKDFEIKYV